MEYAGKSTNEKLACAVLLKQCILDLPWDVVLQMQVTLNYSSVIDVMLTVHIDRLLSLESC